jgi:hypothetical protein
MPQSFPQLKTGVLAQYPLTRELSLPTERMEFLDMGQQVYVDSGDSLRRWRLRLSRLDESELAEVIEFFAAVRGSLGRFEFEDPVTGDLVANCRFAEDELLVTAVGELDARTVLTVMEMR